jgi:hypothetical protein
MQSDFSLILNSANGSGTNNNNLNYYIDFQQFDEGFYDLTFAFHSGNNDIDPIIPAQLQIDFSSSRVYESKTNASCNNSNFIGLLYPLYLGVAGGALRASSTDNPPITLKRPFKNQINVSILNVINTACVFTASTATNTILTVTAITSGLLQIGDFISGTGVAIGTNILNQLTGLEGGIGTYTLSTATTATAGGVAMTTQGLINGAGWVDNAGNNLNSYMLFLNFKKRTA